MKKITFLFLFGISLLSACKSNQKTADKNSDKKIEIINVVRETNFAKPEVNPDFTIQKMSIEKDIATLLVTYSGGCKPHNFSAHFNGTYLKSMPPRATVFLNHQNNGDNCRSIVKDTLYINLTEVRYYKDKEGTVVVGFNGTSSTLEYKYK